MTDPIPPLIESSIEIAWDYLSRTGELGDAMVAGRFLSDTIELMVRRGERRAQIGGEPHLVGVTAKAHRS